ncbi:MAG: hypothetical protein IPK64_20980 [bacterium]|nr:hypothetical protein [bacterium]
METEERVACPWCAEQIMPTAIVCPHCQRNTGFIESPRRKPAVSMLGVVIAALIVVAVVAGTGYYVLLARSSSDEASGRSCKTTAEGVLSVGRYDSPALIRIDNQADPLVDNTDAPPVDGPVYVCAGVGFFNDGYKAPIEYGMYNEGNEVAFGYEATGDAVRVE